MKIPAWFVAWLRQWPKSARQSREPTAVDAAVLEVAAARESKDTRRQHRAYAAARREMTRALAHELGREVYLR